MGQTDDVLEELQQLAEQFPQESADVVLLIALGRDEPWDFEFWSSKALSVLKLASSSVRADVKAVTGQAVDLFGIAGRFEFRELAEP